MQTLHDYGNHTWLHQQGKLEKLLHQAQINASTFSHEFIKDVFLVEDKLKTLVHELLVSECWKASVLPHLVTNVDISSLYMLLFQEQIIANILELVLYHQDALGSLQEEDLVELVDWAWRKLSVLVDVGEKISVCSKRPPKAILYVTKAEEVEERMNEVEFTAGMCALTIIRYMTDSLQQLPPTIMHRIVHRNDMVSLTVQLLKKRPWLRDRNVSWIAGQWVPSSDSLRIVPMEAQVWLIVNALIRDPICRGYMELDRNTLLKESILSLRALLNPVLIDQIPILTDLQRVLEECSLGILNSGNHFASQSNLIIEVVSNTRNSMLSSENPKSIAEAYVRAASSGQTEEARQWRLTSMLETLDRYPVHGDDCDLWERESIRGEVKVHVYSSVQGEGALFVPWSQFPLAIVEGQKAEEISLGGDDPVQGIRDKLEIIARVEKALPSKGKIVVVQGNLTCEAELELPVCEMKSDVASLPCGLWLTIGSLRADSIVLQLKVQRVDMPTHRTSQGHWCVYSPHSGAITVKKRSVARSLNSHE